MPKGLRKEPLSYKILNLSVKSNSTRSVGSVQVGVGKNK